MMRKSTGLVVLLGVAALLTWGCPFAGFLDACTKVECEADEICDNGTCRPRCGNSVCDDNDACTTSTCVLDVCAHTPIPCVTVETCPAACDAACTAGVCTN